MPCCNGQISWRPILCHCHLFSKNSVPKRRKKNKQGAEEWGGAESSRGTRLIVCFPPGPPAWLAQPVAQPHCWNQTPRRASRRGSCHLPPSLIKQQHLAEQEKRGQLWAGAVGRALPFVRKAVQSRSCSFCPRMTEAIKGGRQDPSWGCLHSYRGFGHHHSGDFLPQKMSLVKMGQSPATQRSMTGPPWVPWPLCIREGLVLLLATHCPPPPPVLSSWSLEPGEFSSDFGTLLLRDLSRGVIFIRCPYSRQPSKWAVLCEPPARRWGRGVNSGGRQAEDKTWEGRTDELVLGSGCRHAHLAAWSSDSASPLPQMHQPPVSIVGTEATPRGLRVEALGWPVLSADSLRDLRPGLPPPCAPAAFNNRSSWEGRRFMPCPPFKAGLNDDDVVDKGIS